MSDATLPPVIPTEPRNTIFHQAATASIFAPLIAIGVNILVVTSRTNPDPHTPRSAASLSAIVCSLIIFLGLICGIVALFGIRKHGKKGILVKALCGISIPLLLVAMAIPNFLVARDRAQKIHASLATVEGQLQALAVQLNKQSNKMVDEVTRLDGVEALPNLTLVYKYSLISKTPTEITSEMLDRTVRPNLVKMYNTFPDMKQFRDNGITITYQYRDSSGAKLGEISVGPNDLAK